MSDGLGTLYPLWISGARLDARNDLARAQSALDGLKNRQGVYFESLLALRDAHQRVLDVWLGIPDVLPTPATPGGSPSHS